MIDVGFTVADIKEMTLKQLNLYTEAALRHDKREQINIMGLTRMAFHADQKAYSKLIRDMERD